MDEKKTILITGANSSIGKVAACELAKTGNIIVMLCRNQERGEKALTEVINGSKNSNVHLMICDLSSFSDIKAFCAEFKMKFTKLDILINNAGKMSRNKHETEDGFESHLQINYLAPFLLTNLLIEIIRPGGRIINVSSLAHKIGKINFSDINLVNKFSMFKAYSQSKLALTLFTFTLAEKLKTKAITVNCLHPGIIVSNLGVYRDNRFIYYILKCLKWLFSSDIKGAQTIIYLAKDDTVKDITGKYFYHNKVTQAAKLANDESLGLKLWEFTHKLLNLRIESFN